MPATISRSSRRGFTLIEILGVVVILGIISATIIPQIATRDDQRAAAAARVVMSDLLYAQNRAVAQQKVHYVVFDVVNKNYKVLDKWSPATVIKNPVDGSTFQVYFGDASAGGLKEMSLVSAAFDGNSAIAFDAMGIPQSVNASTGALTPMTVGRVVVGSGTYQLTVTVSPFSGELTVQ
ncbi:type II secretion system protein [Humisphaera borealis]|uniref:Type II secretion system protein H n=1 Tax=Humisphaera borealis TaxID=2807512 RepID=A0A7M2WYD5_9BACT|nr:GspH/FimT family pseudopilin [Humisphaera borealis]QOV90232.1 prepilin-type N-terminal cleavage/methylation domain-containing protein [Humisphaera borealis]